MKPITVDPTEVMQNLTIEVRISRKFRFRLWLGGRLMRLAARVLGAKYCEERDDDEAWDFGIGAVDEAHRAGPGSQPKG